MPAPRFGIHPEHPGDLHPRAMVGVGPRRHVLAAVLDRGLVQPEMASRVTLGELDQLGDDPAAYLSAFIRHIARVRSYRTSVLELRRSNPTPGPGIGGGLPIGSRLCGLNVLLMTPGPC